MKVQRIKIRPKVYTWILLDDDYVPVKEVNSYLKYLAANNYSPNTIRNYCYCLKSYCEFLNSMSMSIFDVYKDGVRGIDVLVNFVHYANGNLSPDKIIYFAGEPQGISIKMLEMTLVAITSMYKYFSFAYGFKEFDLTREEQRRFTNSEFLSELVQSRRMTRKRIVSPKTAKKKIEYITRDELVILESKCSTIRDKFLLSLMFNTGLRVSEALGIRLIDVHLEDGSIDIVFREDNANGARVKNMSERTVYLPKATQLLCRDYLFKEAIKYNSDYLFVSLSTNQAGEPMTYAAAYKMISAVGKKAGIDVHPHMFRHGFAVERIEAGQNIEDISLMMGHKNLESTRMYLSVTEELARRKLRPMVEATLPEAFGR